MSVRKLNNNGLNVISKNLTFYRNKKGLSQAGLARELNLIGIPLHKNDIQLIEANKRTVKDYEVWGFVEVLGIDFGNLYNNIKANL